MARPFTHLNLSSIYHWQELEKDKSFVYSLSPEEIQNGTIDPYILAATTVLHLLVSASRRLLNTDISPFESTGLLASSRLSESPDTSVPANGFDHGSKRLSELNSGDGNDFGGSDSGADKTRSAEHVARMVFKFVAAANEFAEGMDQGDDTKLLRMRTRKLEIVVVPGQYMRPESSQLRKLALESSRL
ncbi:MAG: hypothetical protein Q9201_007451 [Fulgogasparrea decipioides]